MNSTSTVEREGLVIDAVTGEIVDIESPARVEGDEPRQAAIAIQCYKRAREQEKVVGAYWKDLQTRAKDVLAWAMQRMDTDSIESDTGRAYMRAPYSRVTYDAAALDALCKSDPELAFKLAPYRHERQYKGVLTVK